MVTLITKLYRYFIEILITKLLSVSESIFLSPSKALIINMTHQDSTIWFESLTLTY